MLPKFLTAIQLYTKITSCQCGAPRGGLSAKLHCAYTYSSGLHGTRHMTWIARINSAGQLDFIVFMLLFRIFQRVNLTFFVYIGSRVSDNNNTA